MNYTEIMNLRREGNVLMAYANAQELLEKFPDDVWAKRAMVWCVYDLVKENASFENREVFMEKMQELYDLTVGTDESMVVNNTSWFILKHVKDCKSHNFLQAEYFDTLFGIFRELPWGRGTKEYSILMKSFLEIRNEWAGFAEFCEWWGLDNFIPEDYNKEEFNGRSTMALVERVYVAYSKALLVQSEQGINNRESMVVMVDRLSNAIVTHPEYQYPLFYKAKLLMAMGRNEEAVESLRPFVMRKQRDFWVWQLLGEASSDENTRFSCYCKAMLCNAPEDMIVALRFAIANEMEHRGLYDLAKAEVIHVMNTYREKGWRSKAEIDGKSQESWWSTTNPATDNDLRAFYNENKEDAEQFLFEGMPEVIIMVTYVNEERGIANAITADKKGCFFKYSKLRMFKRNAPQKYSVFVLKVEKMEEGRLLNILTIKNDDGTYKERFVRSYEGSLEKREGQNFGFVNHEIYIPGNMIGTKSNGDQVRGEAVEVLNRRRNTWGWQAISIQ